MIFTISDKKKEVFISLFGLLKNASSLITLYFDNQKIHIQGMDKSHVCLFDTVIHKDWFNSYQFDNNDIDNICIDSIVFYNIISSANENHTIYIHFSGKIDTLNIDLLMEENGSKGLYSKYFKIPLANVEYDLLTIPMVEYDAEITIPSKTILEITTQMNSFGSDINLVCTEDNIHLITNGINGEMKVNIPIDDLTEYAICEGDQIDIKYSLQYIHKMCISNKLGNDIEIGISKEYPMRIKYNLGINSNLLFFLAPKIDDV
jgi:proliferating cell nuclear antigen PCNA